MKLVVLVILSWSCLLGESLRMARVGKLKIGDAIKIDKLEDPGNNIFTPDSVQNTESINTYKVDMRYKSIRSRKDKKDLLNIGGSLDVEVNTGSAKVKVNAAGSYLKETENSDTNYEFIFVVDIILRTETLNFESEIDPERLNKFKDISTHYVRSIVYGERMIGKIVFKNIKKKDKTDIQVKAGLDVSVGQGTFDISVEGQFKQLKEMFDGKADTDVKYMTTSDSKGEIPIAFEDIFPAINTFLTKKHSGTPLFMDLVPLSTLSGVNRKIDTYKDKIMDATFARIADELKDVEDTYTEALNFKEELIRKQRKTKTDRSTIAALGELVGKAEDVKTIYSEKIPGYRTLELEKFMESMAEAKQRYISESPLGGVTGSYMGKLMQIRRKYNDEAITSKSSFSYAYLMRFIAKARTELSELRDVGKDTNKVFGKVMRDLKKQKKGVTIDNLADALNVMEADSDNVCNVAFALSKSPHFKLLYNHRSKFGAGKGITELPTIEQTGLYLSTITHIWRYNDKPIGALFYLNYLVGLNKFAKGELAATKHTCSTEYKVPSLESTMGITVLAKLQKDHIWYNINPSITGRLSSTETLVYQYSSVFLKPL